MPPTQEQPGVATDRGAFWPAIGVIVLVAGVLGWLGYALSWDVPRAWRALLINFIFFTPLAAGMVTWPALLMCARSVWTGPVRRTALAAVAFAPVSIAAFIVLVIGREHWAGWLHEENLHNAAWLDETFLFTRDAAALVVLWALAAYFVWRSGRAPSKALAAWLVFVYATVFTLISFDMVMALDPHWFSTLFGGYFFMSGMYAGVTAWALAAIFQRPMADAERRHDLARLIVAFSLLTTYMMFSQLIVIWYEELPDEVRFVIPRLTLEPWTWVSAVLLAVIYLGPLAFLLTVWSKRSVRFLGMASAVLLAAMWIERWWLVTPTLGGDLTLGLVEVSITAAFTAAFILALAWMRPRLPQSAEEVEHA